MEGEVMVEGEEAAQAEWYDFDFEEEEADDDEAEPEEEAEEAADDDEAEPEEDEEEEEDGDDDDEEEEDESAAAAAAAAEVVMMVALEPDEPVHVEIWSLREGQQHLANLHSTFHIHIRAIDVQHAAALEGVLRRVSHMSCQIPGLHRLSSLVKVDWLLMLGAEAHVRIIGDSLPVIGDILYFPDGYTFTFDDDFPGARNLVIGCYLRAFRSWSWELHTAASGVGPASIFADNFLQRIKSVCKLCRRIVAGVLSKRRHKRSENWLRAKLGYAHVELLTLREGTVYFE